MAAGKVITGFSYPFVAVYANNNGAISYTNGMQLARGVNVGISAETGDVENFYADNVIAESAGGLFTGGEVTLTVDGLKEAARTLLMGLPTPTSVTVNGSSVDVYEYDDRQNIPYVGVGFIVRYMENGVESYRPFVLPKVIFDEESLDANTQEESIDFQTTELTATILRDDSTNHRWKRIGADQDSEEKAVNVVKALLDIQLSI